MNLLQTIQSKYIKKSIPSLQSGDVVRIHEKIKEGKKERIQVFEGMIIAIRGGKSLNATFSVRKISFGIGVEKIFPLHSPKIIKIEIIRKIRSRKSKLYYLRNLTQKQIQKRSELAKYVSWEDERAKQEEEELKKEKEAEAKKKKEAKKQEEKELDKKFAETRGESIKEKKASADKDNDKTKDEKTASIDQDQKLKTKT